MKKRYILMIGLAITNIICCSSCKNRKKSDIEVPEKHLVLNEDGSYGGTLNKKYGTGTPKNGEDDNVNDYYNYLDFYNMGSTDTRTMYYNFKPYQKTRSNSDGISCLVSILNYYGFDTTTNYNEEKLVERYESLNSVSLAETEETTEGLSKLATDVSLKVTTTATKPTSDKTCYEWFKDKLDQNKLIIVPFNDGTPGYVTIVGVDNMGTDTYYDDLVIYADPNDVLDHYQDGWGIESSTAFYVWWNITRQNGSIYKDKEFILIDAPSNFDASSKLEKKDDITYDYINHYDNHLAIQPDGYYLSSYYTNKFNNLPHNKDGTTDGGSSIKFNSWTQQSYHHEDSYYYARKDFYNLEKDEKNGLYFCSNWSSHVQNMGSTCGICALTNIMGYYGFDTMSGDSEFDEAIVASDYEEFNNKSIQGVGTSVQYFVKLITKNEKYSDVINLVDSNANDGLGKTSSSTLNVSLKFNEYSDFAKVIKQYLSNNQPMAVSWKPCHGHWTVIIGFNDFNNNNPYDDVVIMGDSSDYRDHYFDGYDIHPGLTFFNRWVNTAQDKLQSYFIIEKK